MNPSKPRMDTSKQTTQLMDKPGNITECHETTSTNKNKHKSKPTTVTDCDCVGRCNSRCVWSNTYSDVE